MYGLGLVDRFSRLARWPVFWDVTGKPASWETGQPQGGNSQFKSIWLLLKTNEMNNRYKKLFLQSLFQALLVLG